MKDTWFLPFLKTKKQNKELRRTHNPFPKPNFLSFYYTKQTEEFRIIIGETVTKLYNCNYEFRRTNPKRKIFILCPENTVKTAKKENNSNKVYFNGLY